MEYEFKPVPKPPKKEKKPYKGIQTRKPLQSKNKKPLKRTPIKKKAPLKKVITFEKKEKKVKKPEKAPRLGIKLPSRASRNDFNDKERDKVTKAFGGARCAACSNPYIEYHHAKFRSAKADGSGRGVWRNGVPLCHTHHELCHKDFEYAQKWRDFLRSKYGRYYYMDKYDLWLLGKIEDPTEEAFEAFMLTQQRDMDNGIAISR